MAVLLAVALGAAACSNEPDAAPGATQATGSGASGSASSSAGTSTSAGTGTSEGAATAAPETGGALPEAAVGETPPPLDPGVFGHEDFVGAIELQYRGDRTSPSAVEADGAYNTFFAGSYDGPEAGETTVLRLTSMVDPRDGDRLLLTGAVIDTITEPNALVVGLHNVLGIDGSVELNGMEHHGKVAGASGVMEVGDRVTLWTPHPSEAGVVYRYVYEVVDPEGGDTSFALYEADLNIDDHVYKASPSEDVQQLTTYICWPPNQTAQRLVTRLHLVESSVEQGSVTAID